MNALKKHTEPGCVIVRCLNPTTNKALHMGHLRNLAIGMATAASLKATGATVITHTLFEDVGDFMAEAVAGYHILGGHPNNEKPDHYIGNCYKAFHNGQIKAPAPSGILDGGAFLDELVAQKKMGVPSVSSLWNEAAGLSVKGQSQTLKRLGVFFDFCDFESKEEPFLEELIARGEKLGLFYRVKSGALLAKGGWKSPIHLADRFGHARENLYLLSFIYRLFSSPRKIDLNLAVAGGVEWKKVLSHFTRILSRLGVDIKKRYELVYTGMVTIGGRKMESRSGRNYLIDDVLEAASQSPRAHEIAKSSKGRTTGAEAAAAALWFFFVSYPRKKDIEFAPEMITQNQAHPAWSIAQAWATREAVVAEKHGSLTREAVKTLFEAARKRSFEKAAGLLYKISRQNPADESPDLKTARNLLFQGLGLGNFSQKRDPLPLKSLLS